MKLNAREMEIYTKLVALAIEYEACNPEIGMGPSNIAIAKRVADNLSFAVAEDDIQQAAEQCRKN